MRVFLLFAPDPDLPDPSRGHPEGAATYEELKEDSDCFVVWREWGEQFKDGYRTHVIGSGIWENLTDEQIDSALDSLEDPE